MKNSVLNLLILVSFLFIISCGKDESSADCANQSLSGTLKGTPWILESITNASVFKGTDLSIGKSGYRLDIVAKGKDGSTLSIIVNEFEKGLHGDCMDVTKTWSTRFSENYYDPSDFAAEVAIFTLSDKSGNFFTTLAEDLQGRFKITSCDEKNHKISGTFNFNFFDENSDEVSFSNGKFENICFK